MARTAAERMRDLRSLRRAQGLCIQCGSADMALTADDEGPGQPRSARCRACSERALARKRERESQCPTR